MMKKAFLSIGFVVFTLFLFAGVPKASAFLISALPKVAGYKITKDYGIDLLVLGSYDVLHGGVNSENYVVYVRVFHPNKVLSLISNDAPTGANACLNFRLSSEVVSCEYVKIVPKK